MGKINSYIPKLHIMPPKGWLNDPNGLCQKDGVYHIFFQYSPDTPLGGLKSWGHYETRDFDKCFRQSFSHEQDGIHHHFRLFCCSVGLHKRMVSSGRLGRLGFISNLLE